MTEALALSTPSLDGDLGLVELVKPAPRRSRRAAPETVGSLPLEALSDDPKRPFSVELDAGRREVFVRDRGTLVQYELGLRPTFGLGWIERVVPPTGPAACRSPEALAGLCATVTAVSTPEVMAVVSEAGYEDDVAALVNDLAERVLRPVQAAVLALELADGAGGPPRLSPKQGVRLLAEVRRGYGLERVSARPAQRVLLERLRHGLTLSAVCERGGFLTARGKPETTWLLRRVGLEPSVCSKTKKRRFARTLSYEHAVALAQVLEADPHELGV